MPLSCSPSLGHPPPPLRSNDLLASVSLSVGLSLPSLLILLGRRTVKIPTASSPWMGFQNDINICYSDVQVHERIPGGRLGPRCCCARAEVAATQKLSLAGVRWTFRGCSHGELGTDGPGAGSGRQFAPPPLRPRPRGLTAAQTSTGPSPAPHQAGSCDAWAAPASPLSPRPLNLPFPDFGRAARAGLWAGRLWSFLSPPFPPPPPFRCLREGVGR
ncbi:uncharacterized protein LOC116597508 [Mustela erminea]|uniref:uncharacterized protein LOC116597508 n=1 Tax=Mustela erminea TaxID=36723 RepID=UPI0013874F80|nr:uncharacterized protein LOC116597508 [Mustela erminea]